MTSWQGFTQEAPQLAKDAVHQSRAMTIARAKRQAPRAAKRAIKPSS